MTMEHGSKKEAGTEGDGCDGMAFLILLDAMIDYGLHLRDVHGAKGDMTEIMGAMLSHFGDDDLIAGLAQRLASRGYHSLNSTTGGDPSWIYLDVDQDVSAAITGEIMAAVNTPDPKPNPSPNTGKGGTDDE